jgi:phosphate transport system substrate-binding protein
MSKKWFSALLLVSLLGVSALAQSTVTLNGAGATFPAPLYFKFAEAYNKATNGAVQINYQSIGSGGGVQQTIQKTVDFGASDAPMTASEMQQAGATVNNFPTVLGADVPSYNLPGNLTLNFTGQVLCDAFLGKVVSWKDPEILNLQDDATQKALLAMNDSFTTITVVHRSDGSGTTFIWTDYLSKVCPEWKTRVGAAKTVNWPQGIGGKGNEGVSAAVGQTPGSLGYVELIYALTNNLGYGKVQNAAGNFILGSLDSIKAAAAGAQVPDDFRVSITATPTDPNAYPIASFTWLLIYPELSVIPSMTQVKAQALGQFLCWAVNSKLSDGGQSIAPSLQYGGLADNVSAAVASAIEGRVKFNGQPIVDPNSPGLCAR